MKKNKTENIPAMNSDSKDTLRILVADDSKTNQEVLFHTLKKMEFLVDVVSTGQEALNALEEKKYDLVLMDIHMPVMDGVATTIEIRNLNSPVNNNSIPIVAVTASGLKRDKKRCKDAGMNDYVMKPVDPDELKKVIECCFNNSNERVNKTGNKKKVSMVKVLDEKDLIKRLGGDEELAIEIINAFIKNISYDVEDLKEAIVKNDNDKILHWGHKIKGGALNIGAHALRDVTLMMEKAGRSNKMKNAKTIIDKLEYEIKRLKKKIEKKY